MKAVHRTIALLALGGAVALAQQAISARSGMIHHVEGRVLLGGQPVESKFGSFPEVKENATLRTEAGRAEVLLTPGVFLRLGEHSAFRMVTNRLVDTRLELLSGAMVIEAADLLKDNSVTVVAGDTAVRLAKKGLYRFDAQPPSLRVFEGEAAAVSGDRTVEVKEGRRLSLAGELAVEKFDREATDPLDRWSRRRGEYVAMANISAANSIRRSGGMWNSSGWAWNPYFGMFTFVPLHGAYSSPYGFRYWSPGAVYELYRPRVLYTGNPWGADGGFGGYRSVPRTASGYSGVIAGSRSSSAPAGHAPTTSSAGAASAPVSRGGGSAGGGRR